MLTVSTLAFLDSGAAPAVALRTLALLRSEGRIALGTQPILTKRRGEIAAQVVLAAPDALTSIDRARCRRFRVGRSEPLLGSEDCAYCPHNHWRRITLMAEPIFGLTCLRDEGCGGWIARYRVQLRADDRAALWEWETSVRSLYWLWLYSGRAAPAARRLLARDAALMKLGRRLAKAISQAHSCEVGVDSCE